MMLQLPAPTGQWTVPADLGPNEVVFHWYAKFEDDSPPFPLDGRLDVVLVSRINIIGWVRGPWRK